MQHQQYRHLDKDSLVLIRTLQKSQLFDRGFIQWKHMANVIYDSNFRKPLSGGYSSFLKSEYEKIWTNPYRDEIISCHLQPWNVDTRLQDVLESISSVINLK